jgi:carbamoyltransferase
VPRADRDRPRVVLGIVDGLHDAGAAVVVDGRLVAAANEERFTRRKLQGGFPSRSLAAVLRVAGIDARDVDAVAVGGRATPTAGTRLFRPAQRLFAESMGICFDRPWHPVDRMGDLLRYRLRLSRARPEERAGRVEEGLARPALRRALPSALRACPMVLVDHHVAHAESAWRTAGPGRWLVVTADAHGDGRSLTVSLGEDGGLVPLHSTGVEASLGAFYSLVTRLLGFDAGRDEGKVLGLAARGDAARVAASFPFRWEGDVLRYGGRWGLRARETLAPLREASREDVAAWVQRGVEEALLHAIRVHLARTGARRLALAGGVFANVRVNALAAALPGVEALHVFPHMGDGGLAAGAALAVADAAPQPLPHAFLGPAPTDEACARAVRAPGFVVTRPEDPDARLADALARGLPVARYDGAMEFGPRALGHRSILAPATPADGAARLNDALRRDDFMPFGPVLRAEDAPGAFRGLAACAAAARFMTVAPEATAAFRRAAPAAVHVDGTARPQVVHREEEPALHALLTRYAEATGSPALVNTSFNRHGEPIVESPDDAVRCFLATGLPVLRLGPFVLERPGTSGAVRNGNGHA